MKHTQRLNMTTTSAKPFVKWAGGKRSIMKHLKATMPETFGAYYEPFLGGGSLFFEISGGEREYYLSDTNEELINAYLQIQKNLAELVKLLEIHREHHQESGKDYYYTVREAFYESEVERAARFIYLMKTCFNGLYRVNSKGFYNVPMGSYKNPNICDYENLEKVREVLNSKVSLLAQNFFEIRPKKGDFVYFDPPYHKLNKKSFTGYCQNQFLEPEQLKLRDFCVELDKMGVRWMLSNSNTPFISEIYKDFEQRIIKVGRPISSKSETRKAVEELIIKNY